MKLGLTLSFTVTPIVMPYFFCWGGGEVQRLGEGWVVEMFQLKIMPIVSCFKRLSIYISFRFHQLWAAVHSIRKKSVIIIYSSQNIKPLHRAVGSPISSHYGSLVWEWECTCNTKCAFKLFGRLFTVPYFFVRSFRYTCSASYHQ